MYKDEFLKMFRIRLKKQLFELKKKWKTNVWNLNLGEKMTKKIKKCVLAPRVNNFLSG